MNLKNLNQHGLTLVEVLAAIVISTFIITTIYSVFSNGQKQVQVQTDKNYDLMDTAYIFKVLSKDIRKSNQVYVNGESGCTNTLCINGTSYYLDSTSNLKKGNETLSKNIETFSVDKEGSKLTISLKQLKDNEVETMKIVLR